jgi:hypothetical protein
MDVGILFQIGRLLNMPSNLPRVLLHVNNIQSKKGECGRERSARSLVRIVGAAKLPQNHILTDRPTPPPFAEMQRQR